MTFLRAGAFADWRQKCERGDPRRHHDRQRPPSNGKPLYKRKKRSSATSRRRPSDLSFARSSARFLSCGAYRPEIEPSRCIAPSEQPRAPLKEAREISRSVTSSSLITKANDVRRVGAQTPLRRCAQSPDAAVTLRTPEMSGKSDPCLLRRRISDCVAEVRGVRSRRSHPSRARERRSASHDEEQRRSAAGKIAGRPRAIDRRRSSGGSMTSSPDRPESRLMEHAGVHRERRASAPRARDDRARNAANGRDTVRRVHPQ